MDLAETVARLTSLMSSYPREYDLLGNGHVHLMQFIRYQTVTSDFDSLKGKKSRISLFSFDWERVVLDEAHNIRNSATKAFKAVLELKSKNKWCLTGVCPNIIAFDA
jgi:hypothetical protein